MTRNAVTQEIYVQPGELIVAASPSILHTVLGSCVGMTFQAAERGIAALCHPMLPRCSMKAEQTTDKRSDTRYVDYAIRAVGKTFDAKGIKRSGVVVKVFGGGDVLPFARGSGRPTVGHLNSAVARQVLSEEGFVVAAESMGGTRGLHLTFNTVTGEVLLRRLKA